MYAIHLTEKELFEVKKAEKKNQNRNIKRRLRSIRLRHEGIPCKEICERLEVSSYALSQRSKLYIAGGIDALCETRYHERRKSQLDPMKKEIQQYLALQKEKNAKCVQQYIYEKTGKKYEISWLWRWCKKNNII